MNSQPTDRARAVCRALQAGELCPADFRAAVLAVPAHERDAWVDRVFGLDELPPDEPQLPRGCAPYLPCSVSSLLRAIEEAPIGESDVFIDVGSGVGRAALFVRLLTGARVIGIEIQPSLVKRARELGRRFSPTRFEVVLSDAGEAIPREEGSVYFLYCPFGGRRLEEWLDRLEPVARSHPIVVCTVDLPPLRRSWLEMAGEGSLEVSTYRSTYPLEARWASAGVDLPVPTKSVRSGERREALAAAGDEEPRGRKNE